MVELGGEELGEEGVSLDRRREGESDVFGVGGAGHASEHGDDVALEGGEGGVRVAGEGNHAFPEGERFAGALGDAVEERFATEGFEGGADVVLAALGDAAGEDDEVGVFQCSGDAGSGGGEVIGEVFPGDFSGAPLVDGAEEGDAI